MPLRSPGNRTRTARRPHRPRFALEGPAAGKPKPGTATPRRTERGRRALSRGEAGQAGTAQPYSFGRIALASCSSSTREGGAA